MSPRIVNWMYTAVVNPILLYGVALWCTALYLVVSSIEKSLSIKEYTLVTFLDIEGAFTTKSLTELGVDNC